MPCDREGTDRAGADTADGATIRILRNVVLLGHFREDLLKEESCVVAGDRVVLEAAIAPRRRVLICRRQNTWVDEHTDRDGHFASVDQVVEDDGDAVGALKVLELIAILKDHKSSGCTRLILCRHVYPVVTGRSWKDPACPPVSGDNARRNARKALGIRTKRVLLRCRCARHHQNRDSEETSAQNVRSLRLAGLAARRCTPTDSC